MELKDFLKLAQVQCVSKDCPNLTAGKTYEVLGVTRSGIKTIDDENEEWWSPISCFEPVIDSAEKPLQEALKPTVYRLDYSDGEYSWGLVHSYDRAELEKLIADATEYHKTIKDLDFDDDEAVDAWLEKHPLNDFNCDQINDLLDIDDYEPLSEYLSISSFEVSGVSQ